MLNRNSRTRAIVLALFFASLTAYSQSPAANTFKAKCSMCHGNDGLGNTTVGKSLGIHSYKAPEVLKMSDAELAATIKNGKNNKMPAFGAQLTDAQIKGMVQYIRTLQK